MKTIDDKSNDVNGGNQEEQGRFRVETVKPTGAVINREYTNDPDKAMQAYVKLSKEDFGKEHGAGAYVALIDNQLKLDAARVAEGNGTYKVQFGKEEGRAAYEKAEKALAEQHLQARDVVAGSAHAAQIAKVGGPAVQSVAQAVGVVDAVKVTKDVIDGKEVRPLDAATAAASVTMTAGVGGPVTQGTAKAVAVVGAMDAGERALNTVRDKSSDPEKAPTMHIDPVALQRVEATRARDSEQARAALNLNSIEPDSEKERKQLANADEAKRSAWLKKADEAATAQPATTVKTASNKVESDEIFTASKAEVKPAVPTEIEKQYLRVGDKFYHPKNTTVVAFEDKGNRLETKSDSEAIAESLVRIAQARGWDEIKVSGSETFRKEVWLEAAGRGMHVKGYTPTEQDKVELAKRDSNLKTNRVENNGSEVRGRESETTARKDGANESQFRGRENGTADQSGNSEKDAARVLVAHGAAKYLNDEKNSGSYYVTTSDDKGKEKTSWGVDLERAIKESGSKVGDKITIASEGQRQVTVTVPVMDDKGHVIRSESKDVPRTSWNVQVAEALSKETTAAAVKKHPELAGTAAAMAAIDKQTERDGMTPEQRVAIAAIVRQRAINSIERGDALPTTKVREEIEVANTKTKQTELTR